MQLAAEATDGQFVTGQDGDDTVAVLVLPRT
jgi:hypothetical protein